MVDVDNLERTDPDALELGQRIRVYRQRAGLTLQQIADTAGFSRSLLSQVERGMATPSLSSLRGIANALGVTVGELFGSGRPRSNVTSERERQIVVRADERKVLRLPKSAVKYELLTPSMNRQIEFLRIEYLPGDADPYEPVGHQGEEDIICLTGSIVLTIEEEEFVLNAGDSASFDCSRPHAVANRGTEPAVVISAITPASF